MKGGIARALMVTVAATGLLTASLSAMAQDYLQGKVYKMNPAEQAASMETSGSGDGAHNYDAHRTGQGHEQRHQHHSDNNSGYNEGNHDYELREDGHNHDLMITENSFGDVMEKAQAGDVEAISQIGYAYHKGIGVRKDRERAMEWYKRAIDFGANHMYSTIGSMYLEKEQGGTFSRLFSGSGSNQKKAREWFEKGVVVQDPMSFMQLGVMYRDGLGGLEKNTKTADWYYKRGLSLLRNHEQANKLAGIRKRISSYTGEEPVKHEAPDRMAGMSDIAIGEFSCSFRSKNVAGSAAFNEYSNVYEVFCDADVDATQAGVQTVVVNNESCAVEPFGTPGSTKKFELYCSSAGFADSMNIRIGEYACRATIADPNTIGGQLQARYTVSCPNYDTSMGLDGIPQQVGVAGMACVLEPFPTQSGTDPNNKDFEIYCY